MIDVRRKVNAICDLQENGKPTGLTVYKDMASARDLHRAIWRATGFWEYSQKYEKGTSWSPKVINWRGASLDFETLSSGLAVLDIVGKEENPEYADALFERIAFEERAGFRSYLVKRPGGIGGLIAVSSLDPLVDRDKSNKIAAARFGKDNVFGGRGPPIRLHLRADSLLRTVQRLGGQFCGED